MLLHGGGGPQTVAGFAELLSTTERARVITPIHPGFGGTSRPDALRSAAGLAALYAALLDQRDLHDVTIVGNSLGGWIAAELALLGSSRISSVVLVDAVGIEVADHPLVDFFSLSMDQVAQLSFHNPVLSPRVDPATLPEAARSIIAGNRASLAVYGGTSMVDPTLRGRLAGISAPTLVLWGEATRSSTPILGVPTPRPSPAPGSSCCPPPATSPRSKLPTNCCERSGSSPTSTPPSAPPANERLPFQRVACDAALVSFVAVSPGPDTRMTHRPRQGTFWVVHVRHTHRAE